MAIKAKNNGPEFGFKETDGRVRIYEFCKDPDGTSLQWYNPTERFQNIENREILGEKTLKYDGLCFDTGEYHSHGAELTKSLVGIAPPGTNLVAIVETNSSAGTKTFTEKLTGRFYR